MDDMNPAGQAHDAPGEAPPLPAFPMRFADVFFNPGRVTASLRERPAWGLAMVVGILLVTVMVALIPAELWQEMQRQAMLRSGRDIGQIPEAAQRISQVMRYVGPAIGIPISEFIFAGIVTLVFTFILGDEGRYRQYLAMVSHAWLITLTVELALVPLKIAQGNPQATVSVGTFFFFLPEGYLLRVFNLLALSKIWTSLVLAAGVHAIDPKRKYATAATVLIMLNVASALIFGIFPSFGG